MTTLVGTQKDFKDAIIALIELEYDAIGAYKSAIEKLENADFKENMTRFLKDHEQHLTRLKNFYTILEPSLKLPDKPDLIKGIMVKMKVSIGNAVGSDFSILAAMLDNELDTNTAYQRITIHTGAPEGIDAILTEAYNDEKRHKAWLEETLAEPY